VGVLPVLHPTLRIDEEQQAGVTIGRTIHKLEIQTPHGARIRIRCVGCGNSPLARSTTLAHGVSKPTELTGASWTPSTIITIAVGLAHRYGRFIEIRGETREKPELCVPPKFLFSVKCPKGTRESNTKTKAPKNTQAPQIHGPPGPGRTLACEPGEWEGAAVLTYHYQWLRDGEPIEGETRPLHLVGEADEANHLECQVQAEDAAGRRTHETSGPVAVDYKPRLSAPHLSGARKPGQQLECVVGGVNASPQATLTVKWLRNGGEITKGSNLYVLQTADEGQHLQCEEIAENGIGPGSSAPSELVQIDEGPQPQSPPQLTGAARFEGILTCHEGTWRGLPPPNVAVSWLREGNTIEGFTARTYKVQAEDEGHSISCLETASNEVSTATKESPRFPIPLKPRNKSVPQVTGAFVVGGTLECLHGNWEPRESIEFSYQWLGEGAELLSTVEKTNQKTLIVEQAWEGEQLSCEVTAENNGGHTSERSAAKTVIGIPENEAPPKIVGDFVVGASVECESGKWEGVKPIGYTTIWLRNGVPIEGPHDSTYSLGPADGNQTLACEVTATNRLGHRSAFSTAVNITASPVNTSPPKMTGVARASETLSCTQGTWAGEEPISYTVHWLRNGGRVGGPGATYHLQEADEGTLISCEVTASNIDGSASVPSTAVKIPAQPRSLTSPSISGGVRVGEVLTCATGNWGGDEPINYSFQWLRHGIGISDAVHQTHTVLTADEGELLECRVTASNGAGSETTPTAPFEVPAKPVNEAAPTLSGEAVPGEILKCTLGTWDGSPTSFTYRWLRDGTAIEGPDESSYRLTATDEDHTITCQVTASNGAGSTNALSAEVSVSSKAREEKEGEVIWSFDNTKVDLAPYSGTFVKGAQQAFTAQSSFITYVGVTIADPNLAVGRSADTVTLKICEEAFCREESEVEHVKVQVNNYGLSAAEFEDPVSLRKGVTYYLVWTPPSDAHGAQWLTFWHGGSASSSGALGMEAVVRGYEFFAQETHGHKVISYQGTQAPPAPYAGPFPEAVQPFTAQSNRITKVGVVLGNPNLQRGKQTQVDAHVSLCTTPTCSGPKLGEGEAPIINYALTTVSLGSAEVAIGQKYYVVLNQPPPVGGEPWQAFWQGNGPKYEDASAYEFSIAGWDNGSTTFEPTYYNEQAAKENIATYRGHETDGFPGVDIPAASTVEVTCKTFDPTSEVAEDEGYWYLIHSPPWEDEYFAPANTFLNGAHGTEKIATDYMVPDC
jgi:hypothetical protein